MAKCNQLTTLPFKRLKMHFWAYYVSWSMLFLCVWMLTRVAQVITAAHRDS